MSSADEAMKELVRGMAALLAGAARLDPSLLERIAAGRFRLEIDDGPPAVPALPAPRQAARPAVPPSPAVMPPAAAGEEVAGLRRQLEEAATRAEIALLLDRAKPAKADLVALLEQFGAPVQRGDSAAKLRQQLLARACARFVKDAIREGAADPLRPSPPAPRKPGRKG